MKQNVSSAVTPDETAALRFYFPENIGLRGNEDIAPSPKLHLADVASHQQRPQTTLQGYGRILLAA